MRNVSKPRIWMAAGRNPARRLAGAAALAFALGGCAATMEALPTALGGLPEGAPERPAVRAEYPGVFNAPPPRSNAVLTDEELKKAEAELTAARDRQNKQAADAKTE
jgi:hypothetical protein